MARMFQQMMGGAMADVGIGGSDLSQVIIILFLCIRYAQISVSCSRTMMLRTIFYLFCPPSAQKGIGHVILSGVYSGPLRICKLYTYIFILYMHVCSEE